jgi:hypothetical protein
MTAYRAARAGGRVFGALALVASLGLAGCSDIDDALFGATDQTDMQGATAPGTLPPSQQEAQAQPAPEAPATQQPSEAGTLPEQTEAAPQSYPAEAGTLPAQAPAPMTATSSTVMAVQIQPGANTGTAVSGTIAGLRGQMVALENSLVANGQQYGGLHGQAAKNATTYHETKARITSRLQLGTTRANPELVAEWNTAQSALDNLTVTINSLNALGTSAARDSATAHSTLDQITATFNVSGAVDEDHRQLTVLEDEATDTIIRTDRLVKNISNDVLRQAAYVRNERPELANLATAIKNGELYATGVSASSYASAPDTTYGGTPLVVIRFNHDKVDYQQILYDALNQALQTRPGAAFSVVAVSPTRGSVAAVHSAQTAAKRHAQDVMRSIASMGVPASRLAVASSTDPNATSSEVRVFVR